MEILTFADEHGTQAAATKYGVAYSTVWQWGKEAGS